MNAFWFALDWSPSWGSSSAVTGICQLGNLLPLPFDVHKFLVRSGAVWRAPVTVECARQLDVARPAADARS